MTPDIIEEKITELKEEYLHSETNPEKSDFDNDWGRIERKARQALTAIYQRGTEDERERIEDGFAKVADYTEDVTADVMGEPINTSFYRLYEGQWEHIIKPTST